MKDYHNLRSSRIRKIKNKNIFKVLLHIFVQFCQHSEYRIAALILLYLNSTNITRMKIMIVYMSPSSVIGSNNVLLLQSDSLSMPSKNM